MNERTKQFLRRRFAEYYRSCEPALPPGFERREWGFILFDQLPDTVMVRHKAFGSAGELKDYITNLVPAHIYHSAAYYMYPAAGTMNEKRWQGADLIFDLDADHLPVKAGSYAGMLENVKKETIKLLGFLTDDFGFTEKHISIVFSGGRGYHVHVREPKLMALGSAERREIVDYVAGTTMDTEHVFIEQGRGRLDLAKESAGGWKTRLNRYLVDYFTALSASDSTAALSELKHFKIPRKKALDLLEKLKNPEHIGLLRKGNADLLRSLPAFREALVAQAITEIGAKVDEPVTSDVKRLIRMPLSLHGGSGLRVTPLAPDELSGFDPLSDAAVFSDRHVDVTAAKPALLEMKGNSFTVKEGINTLPEYAAVYLMCRGAAEYGP